MQTITAKELRDNLGQYVQRARRGESIKVTYRSKPAFTLQADTPKSSNPEPGSPAAMREFIRLVHEMNKVPRVSTLDPTKSIKQLYHESLDADPKYRGVYD